MIVAIPSQVGPSRRWRSSVISVWFAHSQQKTGSRQLNGQSVREQIAIGLGLEPGAVELRQHVPEQL
jgi:hypothetical protein